MDCYSLSSYPDSRSSSPRSRDVDSENQSLDEPTGTYKVKFMCSYGGRIQPRPHDNQLGYIGGDTKILSVDRSIKFSAFVSKLASLCDARPDAVSFKYQLPGEDLDALISVTNDEDLDHMMLEYDRSCRSPSKPPRLRIFLFPLNPSPSSGAPPLGEPKSERMWFVDSLNGIPVHSIKSTSSPAENFRDRNPDSLFGLDKGYVSTVSDHKFNDIAPPRNSESSVSKDVSSGSDCGSEDRLAFGEQARAASDIHRQIHDLQKLQIASGNEQAKARMYATGEYYAQSVPDKIAPPAGAFTVPAQMPISAGYSLPERHIILDGHPSALAAPPAMEKQQRPVYIISGPSGGFYQPSQGVRLAPGPVAGQAYYEVTGAGPEVYREQSFLNAASTSIPPLQQGPKLGQYTDGYSVMQPLPAMGEPAGYVQLGFDSSGRQVYGMMPPPYQAAGTMDGVQAGNNGGHNHEGKISSSTMLS